MPDIKSTSRFLVVGQGIDGAIAPHVSMLSQDIHARGWGCMIRYVGPPAASKVLSKDRLNGIDSQIIETGEPGSIVEVFGLLRSLVLLVRLVYEKRPVAVIFAGHQPALVYPPFLRLVSKAHFIFWDHGVEAAPSKTGKFLFSMALKSIDKIVSVSKNAASRLGELFGVPARNITVIDIPSDAASGAYPREVLDQFWKILGG